MTEGLMSLKDRRVVVVGGTSGIGFAVAHLARDLGAGIVVSSSGKSTPEFAVKQLPGAEGRVVDMCNEASVARFFSGLGGFDHLAVTAGDWPPGTEVMTRRRLGRSASLLEG